jgi:hypothetical protein
VLNAPPQFELRQMFIRSRNPDVTPDTLDKGVDGSGRYGADTWRGQSLFLGRRLPAGQALVIIVALSLLLWAGLFFLIRAIWLLL